MIEKLITLPPATARAAQSNPPRCLEGWFAAADPAGCKPGSGGGTASLLVSAWERSGAGQSFPEWLRASRKMVVHGGGESRRLPAYSVIGKPLIPIPRLPGETSCRADRTLLDLQSRTYEGLLRRAPGARLFVGSGDVLFRFAGTSFPVPEADIVIFGGALEPEEACRVGVLLVDRRDTSELHHCLQKPSPDELRALPSGVRALVDTGAWLLSDRAVDALLRRTGWDGRGFGRGVQPYELYSGLGAALGRNPAVADSPLQELSAAVVELPDFEFYHLGSTVQLDESLRRLSNGRSAAVPCGRTVARCPGAPSGARLQLTPVLGGGFCIRPFGDRDDFRGPIGAETTLWLNSSACEWFEKRGIPPAAAGIASDQDIFDAPLFPVVNGEPPPGSDRRLQWLVADHPDRDVDRAEWWIRGCRLSARELMSAADMTAVFAEARRREVDQIAGALGKSDELPFVDLAEAAEKRVTFSHPRDSDPAAMTAVRSHMLRAERLRLDGNTASRTEEEAAFTELRRAIVESVLAEPAAPRRTVLEDQIVWSRSPARLDLAGGWTDTPPYCILNGGAVLNVAANLNGQPPIQVFAKHSSANQIIIRSIDLGSEERITTYEQIAEYANPRSDFSLARAALAAVGFHPRFAEAGSFRSLKDQLAEFGGGIEISLVAAVPQGSGLGTSSILAVTLLAALNELCGLGWNRRELIGRTMALEQLVTTGGGWQDQAGGLLRGVKLLESAPGLPQEVNPKWLPEHLFTDGRANRSILLYYTGITRLAKNILQEVVRGMFLNEYRRAVILREIGQNARTGAEAIQRGDWRGLCASVSESWRLNQELDSGTNPPEIASILEGVRDYIDAAKLLGAGGGGYLLLFAKDEEAGGRIRRALAENPPNDRARFVAFDVSAAGLEVTRS